MKKRYATILPILLLYCTFWSLTSASAQTLSAGDIAFTGYNSINGTSSDFSFVLLVNITGNVSITFTDVGWNPENGTLTSVGSDGFITWSSGGALAKFTEITIKVNASGLAINSVSHGSASAPVGGTGAGTGFILSGAGDQVLAFTGTQASPTFIAGIHMNSEVASGTSAPSSLSGWDDIKASGGRTYSTNRSGIPPGLTNGTNAVMVVANATAPYLEYDYGKYNCTGSNTSTTDAALKAAINNRDNWLGNNNANGFYTMPSGCTFSVAALPSINTQPANTAVCEPSGASFTISASNVTSYQWEVSTGGSFAPITTSGGIYSGFNGTTLSISSVSASMNGYAYRVVLNGTLTSNAATLTITSPGTWLGGASAAWSNTANWSCGTLPTASTNVTIPAGTTFSPLVDISTAAASNITIASVAALAFSGSNNALSIYGNLSNTGTYNPANGKTNFAGTNQNVPALTYQNLQVSGGGSKTLAGAAIINGALTLSSGFIILGNNNLTVGASGSISGGTINSYVVTNGSGSLIVNNVGLNGRTGNIVFPVGINSSSYTPISINNGTGIADNFKARVINNVYSAYDASDNPTGTILNNKVVARTWLISEAVNGGSDATLTVQWNSGDQLNSFDNTKCALVHYYNNRWHNDGGAPRVAGGLDPYTLSASGIASFSPFSVGSVGGPIPLPLNLLSFSGERYGDEVKLAWTTTNEKNVREFLVERSYDAKNFSLVGTTVASGHEDQTNSYRYADKPMVASSRLYYRLKIVDMNGTYAYSNTAVVDGHKGTRSSNYRVYPNPIGEGRMTIQWTHDVKEKLNISVRDMAAGNVYQSFIPASQMVKGQATLDLKLPTGIYILQLQDDITTDQIRIIKE